MIFLSDFAPAKSLRFSKDLKAKSFGGEVLSFGFKDILDFAWARQNRIEALDVEITSCSPVIPTQEISRIRNNVVGAYTTLRNSYSNVGGSLDSQGLVNQYQAVFNAMEGGSYCIYSADEHFVRDIETCGNGANQILSNGFNQYANNFAARLTPMRTAFQDLQAASNNATVSVEPVINAYKRFWALNFQWRLHTGINASLDNFIAEYQRLTGASDTVFDQGAGRVQSNFDAEVRNMDSVNAVFKTATDIWRNVDGAQGYDKFSLNLSPYQNALQRVSGYSVLKTPQNDQTFQRLNAQVQDVKKQLAAFPNFIPAQASAGFSLDPGTSALKFFSRQAVLDLARSAGQHYTTSIAQGRALIGTGFSYQHGGKMPPHAEHKDGRDCDIFSEYFKVGAPTYNQQKAVQMATFLLQARVTRLIYTNNAVVAAANAACPQNAVAVTGSGHETHMHFDLDTASIQLIGDLFDEL